MANSTSTSTAPTTTSATASKAPHQPAKAPNKKAQRKARQAAAAAAAAAATPAKVRRTGPLPLPAGVNRTPAKATTTTARGWQNAVPANSTRLSGRMVQTLKRLQALGTPSTWGAMALAKGSGLRQLTAAGLVATTPNNGGAGFLYAITAPGKAALAKATGK